MGVRRRKCTTEDFCASLSLDKFDGLEAKSERQQSMRQWHERPHQNPQAGAHQQQQPATQLQDDLQVVHLKECVLNKPLLELLVWC